MLYNIICFSEYFTIFATWIRERVLITLYLIAFNAIVSDSENCQFSTQRRQCTKRPQSCRILAWGYGLFGGLSVFVCCVGMAVPLNRTGCESPPLFFVVAIDSGNIAQNL